MLPGDIPFFIRQASCMRKSTQVTSMFRFSEKTVLSSFMCHFLHLYNKKFGHFVENNYVVSLTIEEGLPIITASKLHISNNKFLPSSIGVFSLNIDESFSATFGRLWSLWITGQKKARLKHSRPASSMKGLSIVVNMVLLITSVEALLNFFCIVSLESLMVTNDLRDWTPFMNWTPKTNWIPDCFVPAEVKLLKIIKKDNVINIIKP